jgi:DNA-binding HxlR family transcriptional regulator
MMNTNHWEVGTRKRHTYLKESVIVRNASVTPNHGAHSEPPQKDDPELEVLVREIIGRVADKWTMLALEVLSEHGRLRFTRLGELIGGVSQKMLTKTLRQMEADGLVVRTVFPVIPPRVEYELTELGLSLGEAFCGVWIWAEQHREAILRSRKSFSERAS